MESDVVAEGSPALVVPPHVLHREVDGQMVLLNLETEQYYGLDEIGAHIVNLLTAEPFDAAMAQLAGAYEVDPTVLLQDVRNLVDALLAAGLLDRAVGAG